MPFKIETDEEEYRLIGPGGETGVEVEYGCHATVDVDGALYYTDMGVLDPDAGTGAVYRVTSDGPPELVEPAAEAENVRFADAEDDGEDNNNDEDGEDDAEDDDAEDDDAEDDDAEDDDAPLLAPDEDEEELTILPAGE